jgi:hypothetical protein
MEFKPTQEAESRKHQQRVDAWLDPNDNLNVLDNEMYLVRVNPDGSNRANLPSIDSLHEQDIDEYSEMSLKQLCEISVDAELHNDRTTMSTVDDYILDKIDNMDLEDDYVERDSTLRDLAKKDKDSVSINQKSRNDGVVDLKSELDLVYDRVIKLREDIKRNKLLDTPADVSELEDDKKNTLANSWAKQTGNKVVWKSNRNNEEANSGAENREMLALPPAPEANPVIITVADDEIDSEERNNDLSVITVHDDEPVESDFNVDSAAVANEEQININEDTSEKKNKSRLKKLGIAAGAILFAGLAGLGIYAANQDDDKSGSDKAETEEVAEETESPIDMSEAVSAAEDVFGESAETGDEAASDSTESEDGENLTDEIANFEAEPGSGFVSGIQEFASASGAPISAEQAFALYSAGLEEFGPDGMITGGTYEISAGNYGISNPGQNSWTPEFIEFMQDRLQPSSDSAELPATE